MFVSVAVLFYYSAGADAGKNGIKADTAKNEIKTNWLESYWFHPLAPQGRPPEGFSDIEASLMPDDCGTCHEDQYNAWQTSRHSASMGPGIYGQFGEPWLDPEGIIMCQTCHAPLYEQQPYIYSGGEVVRNMLYSDKMRRKGLTCAACHVRKHVRYGPTAKQWVDPETPHGGFTEIKDFNRSEFCKTCHQFNPGDRRLNGKLLEDTYAQWKRSPYAKEGKSCANCHMPDRKHTFRGIHSPRMVKDGMTIRLDKGPNNAIVYITNSGTGHKLPTYVTPKISIIGKVMTPDGKVIKGTVKVKNIQWLVSMNLRKEIYDTRLDPGETFKVQFDFPKKHKGNIYDIEIRVYPDEFYRRFYEALLQNPPGGIKVPLIERR